MSVLEVDTRDAVRILTLDRPERRNALNRELLSALDEQCRAVELDADVGAVVITGAGDRAFSAGADVTELNGVSPGDAFELMRFGQGVFDRVAALPIPVLAAVNGAAMGGGCELALACDVRFAAESARFAQPEIKLANVPGWGGTQRLPRLVGSGRAAEMMFSGAAVPADRAEAWGLANRMVPDARLLEETLAFAQELSESSRVALAGIKRATAFGAEHGVTVGLVVEAEAVAECCRTEDQKAAVQAFLSRSSSGESR